MRERGQVQTPLRETKDLAELTKDQARHQHPPAQAHPVRSEAVQGHGGAGQDPDRRELKHRRAEHSHGLVGDMKSPVDVTYLADAVVMLRFFEARGSVRRAISVIKKRTGKHEDTIREFQMTDRGLKFGKPLDAFQGILRGVPTLLTNGTPLDQAARDDDHG